MKELRRRQIVRRITYSIPSLLLLVFVGFILSRAAVRMVSKEIDSAARAKELEARVNSLTLRQGELKNDIAHLQTEEGVKEEIKERFNVTEEGEHVAVIVDDKHSATSTDDSGKTWYQKLWSAIIGGK